MLEDYTEYSDRHLSGDLREMRATLHLARMAYYPDNDPDGRFKEAAKTEALRAIHGALFYELRDQLGALKAELEQAPESKRRNRCLEMVEKLRSEYRFHRPRSI